MADPLSLLRQYNLTKQEIVEREGKIIFGELAWSKDTKTNYAMYGTGKDGTEKIYYTLESLIFILKNASMPHPAYALKAIKEEIPVVHRPDRKNLLAYLNGESDSFPEDNAPLEYPPQGKRSAENDAAEIRAKTRRLNSTQCF